MADFVPVQSVIGLDENGDEKTIDMWLNLDQAVTIGNGRVTFIVGDNVDTIVLSKSSWDNLRCYLHDHGVTRQEGMR